MKKVYVVASVVLVVDIFLYFIFFHSTTALPGADPFIEKHTSFPLNFEYQLPWYLFHMPLSLLDEISHRFLVISVIQWPLIIIGVSKLIANRKNKK
jgi:hypothetical protein